MSSNPVDFHELFRDLDNRQKLERKEPLLVPPSRRPRQSNPAGYLPDEGLVNAMKVALLLRRPLLLTGPPGTGKTDLALYLSWKLGHRDKKGETRPPLLFEAKSTSIGRDLFYSFDSIGRFQAVSDKTMSQRTEDYISYNALGEAILQAKPFGELDGLLPKRFVHEGPRQSVVLIDEVDKAPRDFPNDILNEIERMYFRITELDHKPVQAPEGMEPVVVITSNSEKNLPPAFLRRCIYYHIPFPEDVGRLGQIVAARIDEFAEHEKRKFPMLEEALQMFLALREEETGLERKPATAELIDWLLYMMSLGGDAALPLRKQQTLVEGSLSALVKHEADREPSAARVKRFFE